MGKRSFFLLILILIGMILLVLAFFNLNKTENDLFAEIRTAPVVKLESSDSGEDAAIFVDNTGTTASIADMRIQSSAKKFSEEWLYCFTYNPQEKVIGGQEITVFLGLDSLEINGTVYIPEDGVKYETILEWAEGVYEYYTK